MVLSDDMAQDNAWVQYVLTKLLKDDIPALLRKIGAHPMSRATIFTDNCSKQFKCRFHFGWVADSNIECKDDAGVEVAGERVHVEHHYFGACHGKNISDSEGEITKTYTRDKVRNQTWTVASPSDLCDKLARDLNFIFRVPTDTERDNFEANKCHSRGTQQLLVTKTWLGEGQTTLQERTFLLTKKPNTILGRTYMFIGVGEETPAVRSKARSPGKEIKVVGCQTISRTAATDTPGVLAVYTLSCFCSECLDHKPEKCPLIRKGIMTGPTEFSRIVGHNEDRSVKDYALQELFRRMQDGLPFGSKALVCVDPSDYRGQDIVPVIIARKAPSMWTPEYAKDGMFTHDDVMVWVHDLPHAPECGQGIEYLVPDQLLVTDKSRAIPLTCIAGLGQGRRGYMERSSTLARRSESSRTAFVLRDGVLADARSTIVLLSTSPSSAFSDFQPEALSEEDLLRAPVERKMFEVGTVVKQGFKAPVMGNGQTVAWRGNLYLEANVISVRTEKRLRRHQCKLKWKESDRSILVLAGVLEIVDEGYIEHYRK